MRGEIVHLFLVALLSARSACGVRLDDGSLVSPLQQGDGDFGRLAETLEDSDRELVASKSKAEENTGAKAGYDPIDSDNYNKALKHPDLNMEVPAYQGQVNETDNSTCIPPDSVDCFVQKHMAMIEAHAEVIYNSTLPKNKQEEALESTEPLVTIHADLGHLPAKMQLDLLHARLAANAAQGLGNATDDVPMPVMEMPKDSEDNTTHKADQADLTKAKEAVVEETAIIANSSNLSKVAVNSTKINEEAVSDEKETKPDDESPKEVEQNMKQRAIKEKAEGSEDQIADKEMASEVPK